MPKKKMSPEERKAWGEKMKAARLAKRQERASEERLDAVLSAEANGDLNPEPVEVSQSAPESIQGESELDQLRRHVQELETLIRGGQLAQTTPPSQQNAQVTSRGIVGTVTKYSVDPKNYPDPRDRLFEEPRLKLKGFTRDWWDLEFIVSAVKYDTKDGLHIVEPKFQLKLIRIIEDENGEPSAKRYVLWKGSFFEDPDAALQIAFDKGIEVPEETEKSFLDEMRYLRMRDWLLEAFYPPKPQDQQKKQETVIGNRVVEVYESNSVNPETVPFTEIKKASF